MRKVVLLALSCVISGIIIGLSFNALAQESSSIPSWIKSTAKFWVNGDVGDADFIKALQWLIDNNILKVPQTNSLQQQSNYTPTTLQGFQTYTNNVYKFSIQYPQDWLMREGVNGKVDIGSSSYQINVIVSVAPPSQNNTNYITNVNIKTTGGLNGTSLDDLSTAFKNGIQQLFSSNDFKEINEGKMKIGNSDVFYMEYVININGVNAEVKQILVPYSDNVFVITYGSSYDTYNTYLPQVNKIISTFETH